MSRSISRTAIGFLSGVILAWGPAAYAGSPGSYPPQTPADQPPPVPAGAEIQARGPIHEAYAKPNSVTPVPELTVPKKPPELIEEVPPDQKPEGDSVQWIPGYWSWDDDAKDFVWISGFWRNTPPGRHWLPGHWQEVEKGWMWVPGYWAPNDQNDVQYLPAPPPVKDDIPPTAAPDDTSTYVPGMWVYSENRYLWRPGFWCPFHAGWVWNPATYIWTPTGYIYVSGYWDHPIGERGLLFAPVRFDAAWWSVPRRPFIPSLVIRADFLFGTLFIGPGYRHYYFGDYFENRYVKHGFIAWPEARYGKNVYDPNYNYFHIQHAKDPKWESGIREVYRGRTSGAIARPPHTFSEQTKAIAVLNAERKGNTDVRENVGLTRFEANTALVPLKTIDRVPFTGLQTLGNGKVVVQHPVVKLEPVPRAELEREKNAAVRLNEIGKQRHEMEEKILSQGNIPRVHTDPVVTRPIKVPAPIPPVIHTEPPATRVVVPPKSVPAAPMIPHHVERPIPNFTPPHPPAPPERLKKGG